MKGCKIQGCFCIYFPWPFKYFEVATDVWVKCLLSPTSVYTRIVFKGADLILENLPVFDQTLSITTANVNLMSELQTRGQKSKLLYHIASFSTILHALII